VAGWVATNRSAQRLSIAVFPHCVPGRTQEVTLEVNGQALASHRWQDCDTWSADIDVPAALIEVGENRLMIHAANAARPIDVSNGANADARWLSVGFTRLQVH
jgi:hypothetical protein